MKKIFVVFKKELIDTLRDRRTLISMILIPLLLFPVLLGISSRIMISQIQKAQERMLNIALFRNGNAERFERILREDEKVRLVEDISLDSARALIVHDSLQAAFVFDGDFDENVSGLGQGKVTMYYKAKDKNDIETMRVQELLNRYETQLRDARFAILQVSESVLQPIDLVEVNLASDKERLAEVIGGFLPYLFIIFCFMGGMYPAIDLAAGEKERGTLETLLTAPVGNVHILAGKFSVVVLTGISTAVVSMIGLYVGILQVREIPAELMSTILGILEMRSILLLLSLLFPLTVFFAGIQLSLSMFARSFKEAQSIINPMIIVVIVPAFLGLMPGIDLNPVTALVPILNVSLTTKAIIAGTIKPLLLLEVYASLIIIAGISLLVCARIFGDERTIFRSS